MERNRQESISDLVRFAIDSLLDPEKQDPLELTANERMTDLVKTLARETGRPNRQVIEECVAGIIDLLETGRSPLIIEEIKLRRNYSNPPSAEKRAVSPMRSKVPVSEASRIE